ncbi:MAG: Stf0 family sulfotransferase [Planctomycetota bacterium]|nr:Stf0 family sulfotransferase [Planctomycetota bacterium]
MKYLICVTNRVGSTWLCSMLASTGVAGDPAEHFTLTEEQWSNFPQHYQALSKYDPLGIKTAYDGLVRAIEFTGPRAFQDSPCIWLRRRDTLAQAISNYRAMRTGQWLVGRGETVSTVTGAPDKDLVVRLKNEYEHCNNVLWPAWFQSMEIEPLQVWYEDLCREPEQTVRRACEFLGLPSPTQIDMARLQIQRDDINRRWREAFTAPSPVIRCRKRSCQ